MDRSHLKDLVIAANNPNGSPEWRAECVFRYVATCVEPGMSLADLEAQLGPRAWCLHTVLYRAEGGGPALLGAGDNESCYHCGFKWLDEDVRGRWNLIIRISGPQGNIRPRTLADLLQFSRNGLLPNCRVSGFRLDWPYGSEVFEGDSVTYADAIAPVSSRPE